MGNRPCAEHMNEEPKPTWDGEDISPIDGIRVASIRGWDPGPAEWEMLLGLCPPERAAMVKKFAQSEDQQRSVVSQLLQIHACTAALPAHLRCDPMSQLSFKTTKGGKPFAVLSERDPGAPNLTYNATHDGDYVGLAVHGHHLCGLDITQIDEKVLEIADVVCSPAELEQLNKLPEAERPGYLHLVFAAKEAYSKAVGVGVGREMTKTHFSPILPADWLAVDSPSRSVAGAAQVFEVSDECGTHGRWCLQAWWLDESHLMVSALGAVSEMVDANGEFRATLQQPEYQFPSKGALLPTWQLVSIADLVPAVSRAQYVEFSKLSTQTIEAPESSV